MPLTPDDKKHILTCCNLAQKSLDNGDNPFGAVITCGDKIIKASNHAKKDITQHAEIVAIRKAQKKLKTTDLSKCALYSICEPCPMCSFMIREAKIKKKVVFALKSPFLGGFSKWPILQDQTLIKFKPVFDKPPEIITGVLFEKAAQIFDQAGWTMHRE